MSAPVLAAGVILVSLPARPNLQPWKTLETWEKILRIGKITIGSLDDWTPTPGVSHLLAPDDRGPGEGPASAGQFCSGQLHAGPTSS